MGTVLLWESGRIFDDFRVDTASKYMRKFELETDVRSLTICGKRFLNGDSGLVNQAEGGGGA